MGVSAIQAKIRQDEWERLGDDALSAACFEPLIRAYKEMQTRGEDFTTQVYRCLSKGQQVLFVFRTYYNHAIESAADLYWWTAYYRAQPERWAALLNGLDYLQDAEMRLLLETIEQFLRSQKRGAESLGSFTASITDVEQDPALQAAFKVYYRTLQDIAPRTLQRLADDIRSRPDDFIAADEDIDDN